ncbi:hypothetical protein B0H14DRAFT_2564903 [Mycena olivaceomarginata]|nr:hypothetical protein B0H14DRAFT_2564903 [Mycena olivaceomarginata]
MAIGSGGGDLEKVMLIISRAGDDQLEVPNIPEVVTDSGEQEMINSKREIMNARCCRPAPQIGMIVLYYYDRVLRDLLTEMTAHRSAVCVEDPGTMMKTPSGNQGGTT